MSSGISRRYVGKHLPGSGLTGGLIVTTLRLGQSDFEHFMGYPMISSPVWSIIGAALRAKWRKLRT